MALTMSVQQKTLNIVSLNINQAKEQNIRRGDYQSNWFTQKNTKELSMLMREKSRFKIGVVQNVKH